MLSVLKQQTETDALRCVSVPDERNGKEHEAGFVLVAYTFQFCKKISPIGPRPHAQNAGEGSCLCKAGDALGAQALALQKDKSQRSKRCLGNHR